jgi:regulation of enolase protein 1 (concanavalin A-like superfamily)
MANNKEVPMHRLVALLLCALITGGVAGGVAGGLLSAPAPFPRSGRTVPWVTGWDRVVNPEGDCTFDRKGDHLTITVPGKGHEFDFEAGRLIAPHLLRDVEGDFAVQVRVGGDFHKGGGRAGLLVLAGDKGVTLSLGVRPRNGRSHAYCWVRFFDQRSTTATTFDGFVDLNGKAGSLRLERQGHTFTTKGDLDGQGWKTWEETEGGVRLPQTVKVGVFVEATASGSFKAVFDQFKVTPLAGPARSAVRPH